MRVTDERREAIGRVSALGEGSRCFPCLFLTGEKGFDVDVDGSVLTARDLDLEVDKRAEVEGRGASRGEPLRRSAWDGWGFLESFL